MSADRIVDDPRFFREENDYSLSTKWRKRAPGEPLFNEAQQAIIDERWELDKRIGINSPVERRKSKVSHLLAIECLMENSQPRAVRKSPEQIKILEEYFEKEQHSYPGDMILLAYETKLEPLKLRQWFGNQKRKLYKTGWEYDGPNIFEPDVLNAKRMWNEYMKNPRQYAKDIWDTKVCRLTGRRKDYPTHSEWRLPTVCKAKFGSDDDNDEQERWEWSHTRPQYVPRLILG